MDEDFAKLFAESEGRKRDQRIRAGDRVRGRVVAVGQDRVFVALGAKAEAEIEVVAFRDPATGEVQIKVGDEVEATVVDDGAQSGTIVLKRSVGRGSRVPGELEQAHNLGLPVEGLVTAQNKGGFDVQVAGVRAFCPGSQIDLRRGADPTQYVGQRFTFRVTKIDGGGRNVVVSRRALLEEESARQAAATWERLHEGAVVQGRVSSIRDFGAFVDLGGIDGMIHVSELGWARSAHPSEVLTVGQEVSAQVVKIERGGEGQPSRIALSLKALEADPWSTVADRFPVGSTIPGIVRRLEAFGAFVEIAPGIDGLVHVSKITLDRRIAHPRQVINPGDQVEVTVTEVDPAKRRISLSMVEQARQSQDAAVETERRETAAAIAQTNTPKGFGTFGDLLAGSRAKRDR